MNFPELHERAAFERHRFLLQPTPTTYFAVKLLQKFAFLISISGLFLFLVFLLEPFFTLRGLPQIDRGGYYTRTKEPLPIWLRFVINISLCLAFWVQHFYLAKHYRFHKILILGSYQHHFYEKPLLVMLSGLELWAMVYLSQPIRDITVMDWGQGFMQEFMAKVATTLVASGLLISGRTLYDMRECDLFGFDYIRKMKMLEGTEFPFRPQMKELSRVALCCRNPLQSGMLMVVAGSMLYPSVPLSFSRFMICSMFITGLVQAAEFNDIYCLRKLGPGRFNTYRDLIARSLLPDLNTLFFKSEQEIEEMRTKIKQLCLMEDEGAQILEPPISKQLNPEEQEVLFEDKRQKID
ncbi:hypothetical protein FGO68_gene14068 [Halteria grandinella]|uniref:Nuclear envelope membrane protein n=1 Tax=Halteria grandinella TaxID=5974 RepID=A0A8J8NL74_HALGN|nr:hypothetical protein FGO68_gene14068 [Halteria grandinella]